MRQHAARTVVCGDLSEHEQRALLHLEDT